jgi:transcriptional regulator with XRE-family HTH domain
MYDISYMLAMYEISYIPSGERGTLQGSSMRIRTIWELGLRIRDRRLELGWSQAELADRVGTTRQWVVNLELGNPGAALGQVLQTMEVLGLRMDVRDRRRRNNPDGAPPRRRRNVTYDDVRSFLDEVVERARDPEAHDPLPGGGLSAHDDVPLGEPPPRTPLRRREEE